MAKAKRAYHHGNLRGELLENAWQLVRQHGLAALNLRALARQAGVTHGAPYHHFADKEALLVAMTLESFELFDTALGDAALGASTARERVIAVGRAYIDFAMAHPSRLELMFGAGGHCQVMVADQSVPRAAFDKLFDSIVALQQAGGAPPGDPMPLALLAWSMVHGFAQLASGGSLNLADFEASRERLLDDSLDALSALAGRAAPSAP